MTIGILIPAFITLVAILGIGFILAMLYKRSTRDTAFVRTGLGGKKVVLDGGAIVLPIFHSVASVNLNTLRLEVRRGESDALITKDRLRVDIGAEFYVRVQPEAGSIALAAQTLGDRTNDADELRQLIEAKFIDALRSAAATITLSDLQEKRTDFVKAVQEAVAADLQSNGLELESVSLTRLDQTDIRFFNETNVFDAEGLTALTRISEQRRKERNEVKRDTEVSIAEKDREATELKLGLEKQQTEATLNQKRDIANATSKTRSEVAQKEAEARQAEEEARINSERTVAEREADARRVRESAQINAEREVRIAAQERDIAISEKSEEESRARAKADEARALAVAAEEKVATAKAVEIADRTKRIAVIAAQQEAETQATAVTVAATAEKEAAQSRAEAIETIASANANAAKTEATGIREKGLAEAEALTAINTAKNAIGDNVISFELARERIRIVPEAIAQAVKPIENIKEIRIFDTGGMLGRGTGDGGASGVGTGEGLAGQLLSYQANKPVLDRVLSEAGFTGGDNAIDTLVASVNGSSATPKAAPVPAAPAPAAPAQAR